MPSDFDEREHPRGQPENAGRFRRRLLPKPPLANRRRRGPVRSSASLEEMAKDALAKPEKCQLCRKYVVIVTPRPGSEPVEWCGCGDNLRNELGLPLVWEIVDEIVRQGRLPVPNCPYCGVGLECPDPSVHVQGLHGRECPASRHFLSEGCENRPDALSPRPSSQDDTITYERLGPELNGPADRGSEELQGERGSCDEDPPRKELRKAKAAERVAAGALVLSVAAATFGWSSTLEVQLLTWGAVAAAAVLTVRALPELRQRWREGTQLKAESGLLSELNGHLSRLVAHAAAANDAIKAFDDGIEQSDQQDPAKKEMAGAMRRALLDEARERVATAGAATGKAQAVTVLPHRERIDAITELIKELEATTG